MTVPWSEGFLYKAVVPSKALRTRTHFLRTHMAVLTRKTNATTRPGDILLKNKQPRRTRQQIELDEARAAAAARAASEERAANHSAVLGRIAQLEDSMENEDAALRMHSIRPDLHQPRYVTESHQPINHGADERYREPEPEELEGIDEGPGEERDLPDHTQALSSSRSINTTDGSGSDFDSDSDSDSDSDNSNHDATEVESGSDDDMSLSEESTRHTGTRAKRNKVEC